MGAAYFIVLDNPKPKFDPFVNGKSLSQEAKKLAKICDTLGIKQLDDFISYSPEEARGMMEDMGVDEETIEATELPDQQWFKPDEGLEVVAKLVAHIEANPKSVKDAKAILAELAEYTDVLTKAKKAKMKFCLQVDC
jgi:hypothetical protein